ncbi:SlyX family protein [Shewanella corallii]|uniref:Protein SlyX homolog n=2 Tax=Shewanella TaxID=22 RepID=A0ABT0N5H6_9GAMM|nr:MULTISPECIES: SlyX family protein [Shewanella]MCL1037145.1 SlyX family protein [Shewanella submarina]MCL2913635.1 SlyX family protein [Shewanella corallii]
MNDALQTQLDELETRIAFQDGTIEELNMELIKLNDLVARQQYQMQLIVDKLRAIEPSNMASQSEETPPPHY